MTMKDDENKTDYALCSSYSLSSSRYFLILTNKTMTMYKCCSG